MGVILFVAQSVVVFSLFAHFSFFHTLLFYVARTDCSVFYSPSLTSLSRAMVMLLCCDVLPWRILVSEKRGDETKGKEGIRFLKKKKGQKRK